MNVTATYYAGSTAYMFHKTFTIVVTLTKNCVSTVSYVSTTPESTANIASKSYYVTSLNAAAA